MADIFISYAREDRAWVKRLVDALTAEGWVVWWDLNIRSGESFDEAIERKLQQVRCVVAVWSANTVKSKWVRAEAAWGADRNKMVSIRIKDDPDVVPLKFYLVHAESMEGWNGSRDAPAFRKLVEDVRAVAEAPKTVMDASGRTSELAKGENHIVPVREWEPLSTFRDPLRKGGDGPELLVIPSGSFWMGSLEDDPLRRAREGPRHRVMILRPFALGRTPVSFEEYESYRGAPANGQAWKGAGGGTCKQRVVRGGSWNT